MMESRKPDSFYMANIEAMPTTFENQPQLFGSEERNLLIGSPFLKDIKEDIDDTKEDYDTLFKEIPEFRQFGLREFEETLLTISSRVFGIKVGGVKMTTMVPFMDMLNHAIPDNAYWKYRDSKKEFHCIAEEDIKRNDEVFISYGKKGNKSLLLNYGFTTPDNNMYNQYTFRLELEASDKLYDEKVALLGANRSHVKFKIKADLKDMSAFLSFLRLMEFDEDIELLKLAVSNLTEIVEEKFDGKFLPFLSPRNELKVWYRVKKLAEESLVPYQTTLEEDKVLL